MDEGQESKRNIRPEARLFSSLLSLSSGFDTLFILRASSLACMRASGEHLNSRPEFITQLSMILKMLDA